MILKYVIEGLAVIIASHQISGGRLDIKELLYLALTAAAVFLILDMFSPSIAAGARQGSGFGIGYGLVQSGGDQELQDAPTAAAAAALEAAVEVDAAEGSGLASYGANAPYKLVDGEYSAKILLAGFNEHAKGYNYADDIYSKWPFSVDVAGSQRGGDAGKDTLANGETLAQGESLKSKNGLYTLTMQSDGNLVIYDVKQIPVWSTQTQNKSIGPYKLVMQKHNNLVLYDGQEKPLWATTDVITPGSATLTLQDDRNLCVYNGGQATWCSSTQLTPALVVGQPPPVMPAPAPQLMVQVQVPTPISQPMKQEALIPITQEAPTPMTQEAPTPMTQESPSSMEEMAYRRMMPGPESESRSMSEEAIIHDKNYRRDGVLYSGDIIDITSANGQSYLQRGMVDSQIIFDRPLAKIGTNLSKLRIVHPKHGLTSDSQRMLRYGESVYIMHNAYFNNTNLNKYIKHGDRLQSHQDGSLFRAFKIYDAKDTKRTGPIEVGQEVLLARGDQAGEKIYVKIESDRSVSSISPVTEASRFSIKPRRVYEAGSRNLCICPKETLYP